MTIRRTSVAGRPAWILDAGSGAMLVSITADGGPLVLDHWGAATGDVRGDEILGHARTRRAGHLAEFDGVPLAYPTHGDPVFKEPCLAAIYHDGTRAVRLTFRADRVTTTAAGDPVLEIELEDPAYQLAVIHRFAALRGASLIERSVRLENRSREPVVIERALTAALPLPPGRYEAFTLHGRWGREFQLARRPLLPGKLVTESRRGFTSHEANPWFAIGLAGQGSEHHGPVWFGALAWSGNWATTFEVESNDSLHVTCGVNPFDFGWLLAPGEAFETPALVCGYTDEGLGGASRILHAHTLASVLPAATREAVLPVLYNSWEATKFAVTVGEQIALAERAREIGVELFVVDDGWFGQRASDHAGLGDWTVNAAKFPRGLGELIDRVHGLGMRFGLWVEPEMVNPDSDLYRAHPDWVFHYPQRPRTEVRNQLVLDFAIPAVRDNIHRQLAVLLREHRIDFFKWDCNRPITEGGWPEGDRERQREAAVRHVRGVYEVIDRLREEFPALVIETCCSGGGRVDLGILARTDQAWTSDNTEATDRLPIQYGYSRAYPARTMVCWVTDCPNDQTGRTTPLPFRFHVAMQGVLGIGGHILRWTPDEVTAAHELVAQYKEIRRTVQRGTQYWLVPPGLTGPCAVEYVSPDRREAVLLLYQVHTMLSAGPPQVRLLGLDPARRYRRGDGAISTGAALMAVGVPAELTETVGHIKYGDLRSQIQVWRAIDD